MMRGAVGTSPEMPSRKGKESQCREVQFEWLPWSSGPSATTKNCICRFFIFHIYVWRERVSTVWSLLQSGFKGFALIKFR